VSARLAVHVQPRASKTELAGLHDGVVKIRIAAPPVDDAANRELIDFVAARLGIARRRVRLASGATGRRKLVDIDDVEQAVVDAAFRPAS
jgi:uncharacterized protein (TIGR00251 family)